MCECSRGKGDYRGSGKDLVRTGGGHTRSVRDRVGSKQEDGEKSIGIGDPAVSVGG